MPTGTEVFTDIQHYFIAIKIILILKVPRNAKSWAKKRTIMDKHNKED
jgi:hypothetical protein